MVSGGFIVKRYITEYKEINGVIMLQKMQLEENLYPRNAVLAKKQQRSPNQTSGLLDKSRLLVFK